MSFWQKIQNQPESTKKIILWITVVIFGIGLLYFWFIGFQRKIEKMQKEGAFNPSISPPFGESLKNNYNSVGEDLNKLEELLKEADKEATSIQH